MNRAFYERVLFERVEEINKSKILGIDKSEMVKIRILDWGTNRDGTPFGQVGTQTFEPGMIAQLSLSGNNITCGVSNGTAPIGIISMIILITK